MRWRRTVATVAAILLGLVFVVSGGWKVLRPFQSGELLEQAQVPAGMGVVGAAALGTRRTVHRAAAVCASIPALGRITGIGIDDLFYLLDRVLLPRAGGA